MADELTKEELRTLLRLTTNEDLPSAAMRKGPDGTFTLDGKSFFRVDPARPPSMAFDPQARADTITVMRIIAARTLRRINKETDQLVRSLHILARQMENAEATDD
ncbi:hypothetical protein [Cereibacter sphaeroides]|jgi:hypothetical protein|uniref:hypothetical protein n=1 Tax=Cereibacter sphaeroides TaxID=1063 RepID=UPI0000663E78|nr:hypothetical protein Rsph17029_0673 [Cereibacter sphaeroides ATCC 17029]